MLWHDLFPDTSRVIHLLFAVVGLALVPLVLVRRKEPGSTIAWILALVLLPAVGAVLFLMFGRDRVRWPARRKRELDKIVRAQVEAVARGTSSSDAADLASQPEISGLERALFRVGERLTHLKPTGGNKVEVLNDGDRTYEELFASIDGARRHVHAQYYLIRDDATGRAFRDKLANAAKRGVKVRLLMDGFGCLHLGKRWCSPLVHAGGHIARFMPMRTVLFEPVNLRNHRKIVVVDGETAYTGGFNVGDEYRGRMPGVGEWRDVHVRIEGPAAPELQRVFFQDWAFATGELIEPIDYFPETLARRGDAIVAIVPSGPDTRTEAIHRLFFGAIVGGERQVAITTPYFVPTESILVALEFAAMRGVDVKLILPGRSNHAVTYHVGRSFYSELLDAGVDVREYQPGIVHAKTLVVDQHVALVGSANMDMRSFRQNFEVHTLIHDAAAAKVLQDSFQDLLSRTRRIEADEWRRRPTSLKIKEGASRLVSPLL